MHKKKNLLLFLQFSGWLLMLIAFTYREFLFGDALLVFKDLGSDSYVNDYPNLYYRMLCAGSGTAPGWSFATGLGQNLYPFSFEPVSALLFGSGAASVATVMLAMNLVYVYLAGLMMFLLLGEMKLHPRARILGGLAYAFSGYSMLSSTWALPQFAPQAFHFALLLWSLEKGLAEKKFGWVTLAVALIAMNYPVNLYFAGLVCTIYISARCYWKGKRFHETWPAAAKLIFFALLGVGSSAFISLDTVYAMMQSPRGTSIVPVYSEQVPLIENGGALWSSVLRLFHPAALGDAAHFRAYRNYFEAPLLYCGILFVLATGIGFHLFGRKGKRMAAMALALIAAVYLLPPVRNLAWLRLGDYYRVLNLLAAMALVIIGSHALSRLFNPALCLRRSLLIVSGASALLLLTTPRFVAGASVYPAIALTLLYFFLLLCRRQLSIPLFHGLLTGLLFFDLGLAAEAAVQNRNVCHAGDVAHEGYDDASATMIRDLRNDNPSFFRLEKNFYSGNAWLNSYNEALVQGYRSSATYGPFNNANYIRFLQLFDVIPEGNEAASRFVTGLRKSPELMKLCATKYFISRTAENDSLQQYGFEALRETNSLTLWKDTASLPFGFCYDRAIDLATFSNLTAIEKKSMAFTAIALPADALASCKDVAQTSVPDQETLADQIRNRRQDTLSFHSFRDDEISGTIDLAQSRILFFSMPYDEGWTVFDHGRKLPLLKAFGGLTAVHLEKGTHAIMLKYGPPYKRSGIIISLCAFVLFLAWAGRRIFYKTRNQMTLYSA